MAALSRANRSLIMRLVLAAALAILALPAAALGQDAPPAQNSAPAPEARGAGGDHASPAVMAARHAAREACAADVVKLCPDAGGDRAKVGECMRSHRKAVSAACRDALGNLMAARAGQ
jgi:hypothetical protein